MSHDGLGNRRCAAAAELAVWRLHATAAACAQAAERTGMASALSYFQLHAREDAVKVRHRGRGGGVVRPHAHSSTRLVRLLALLGPFARARRRGRMRRDRLLQHHGRRIVFWIVLACNLRGGCWRGGNGFGSGWTRRWCGSRWHDRHRQSAAAVMSKVSASGCRDGIVIAMFGSSDGWAIRRAVFRRQLLRG